jgi:hypothetical protein
VRTSSLLLVAGAAVVAFAISLGTHSEALALVGTVLAIVSLGTLFARLLLSDMRRHRPEVKYDHSFVTWLLGDTSTPHRRGAGERSDIDE